LCLLSRLVRFVKIPAFFSEIRYFNTAGFQLDQNGLLEKLLPTAAD
jgi:hypothetical protein